MLLSLIGSESNFYGRRASFTVARDVRLQLNTSDRTSVWNQVFAMSALVRGSAELHGATLASLADCSDEPARRWFAEN